MSLNLDKSAWETQQFGEIIQSVTDRVNDPSAAGVDRYVGLEHLDPGSLEISRWGTPTDVEAQKLRFQSGDIVFGRRRAYQKKVGHAEFDGICSAHALVLRAIPDRVDPAFLPFFISSDYFLDRAIAISVGSLSPTINWRDLAKLDFALPPLDEQRRLADLLWAAEHHRRRDSDMLVAAEGLTRQLRRAHFGSGGDTVKAGDAFEITIGRQRSPNHASGQHMVPYLRSANVTDSGIDLTDVYEMNFTPAEQAKFMLRPGDVLVSEGSASSKAVGMPAVYQGELAGVVCFQNTLLRFRPRQGMTVAGFVAQWCQWAFETGEFLKASSGTSIHHIGSNGASSMLVTVASIAEQEELVARVSEVQDALAEIRNKAEATVELRRALLQEVFS